MKIRAGFVTNSSSTSFLIITRDELNEEAFLALMGVLPSSPIADLFRPLFVDIMEASRCVDLAHVDRRVSPEAWFDCKLMSPTLSERLRLAAGQELKGYFGHLSSDGGPVQFFFCTDAFEIESESIYFNGLECIW